MKEKKTKPLYTKTLPPGKAKVASLYPFSFLPLKVKLRTLDITWELSNTGYLTPVKANESEDPL